MIKAVVIKTNGEVVYDVPLKELKKEEVSWYWVDFERPTSQEVKQLSRFFHFHPLAIEDCLEYVQRPKMDNYEKYLFLVFHSIHQKTLEPEELDLFINQKFIVTFHKKPIRNLTNLWHKVKKDEVLQTGPLQVMYQLTDLLVDDYFPPVYKHEDLLNDVEANTMDQSISELMEVIFDIRTEISKLRRTIIPMRDLLYRMISSSKVPKGEDQQIYFQDIYDHLLKLVEMIDANRELTADIRDSYLSISSDRMNRIMMTLTIISSIFLPLTFIAGVYGMNFQYMPELAGKHSYFIVLGVMVLISASMLYAFAKMGWFRFHKGTKL
ncbi:magnesium/cobalt transporter CorA [Metabacillus arenae]|uniref:Magnesium transport protein CorA n=1 Tax=Metabacillus arenae TaxID=2771434 RepID=A0A926RZY1_9BACI|nr:magnesium/cobalt transporter CorA [Metabacillus arenae]MBD1383315.1 magnesium/cobalt transporter CorA [Metabacillus arenae]